MKSTLKDLRLEALLPKFAAERIEPENVAELYDDELVRLGVTTIGVVIVSVPFVLTPKKKHQSMAAAALGICHFVSETELQMLHGGAGRHDGA